MLHLQIHGILLSSTLFLKFFIVHKYFNWWFNIPVIILDGFMTTDIYVENRLGCSDSQS